MILKKATTSSRQGGPVPCSSDILLTKNRTPHLSRPMTRYIYLTHSKLRIRNSTHPVVVRCISQEVSNHRRGSVIQRTNESRHLVPLISIFVPWSILFYFNIVNRVVALGSIRHLKFKKIQHFQNPS